MGKDLYDMSSMINENINFPFSFTSDRAEDLPTAGFRSLESETAAKRYSHLMSLVTIGIFRSHMGQSGDPTSLAAPLTTALDRLRLSIDQQSEVAIQRQCLHAVFITLVKDRQADTVPETNFPLVRFAIFLMLDHTGTFKYLGEIRQVVAIVRYWCRLVALVDILQHVSDSEEQEIAHIEEILIALRDGYNTPVGWLLQVSRFAMAALSAHPPMQRFDWEPESDFGALHIDGRRVSLEGLGSFATGMLQRCESGLRSVLCGVAVPRRLLQDDMYDQYNQQREGYCFLDEPENGLTGLQLDTRLVRNLMNSRSGREQFFDDAGWNHRQLRQWFESTAALMDSILICMHLTYGQPARASELCALLCRNHKDAPRTDLDH
jgi:hypothetical protein